MLSIPASSTLLTFDFLQWTLLQQESAISSVRHWVKKRPLDEDPSNCFASLKTYCKRKIMKYTIFLFKYINKTLTRLVDNCTDDSTVFNAVTSSCSKQGTVLPSNARATTLLWNSPAVAGNRWRLALLIIACISNTAALNSSNSLRLIGTVNTKTNLRGYRECIYIL